MNTRIEAESNVALSALARAGARAFGYTTRLKLDHQVAQLVRLRVAQINNCAYCLNVHHEAATEAHIDPIKVRLLSAWWETTLFTDRERAALSYAERLTRASEVAAQYPFQAVHD